MFIPIVNTSISASWLILAIIVIRLVFMKMPKAWTCVLWGLVAIRLICPFSIESPLSLIPSAETIPEEVLYMEGVQQHDPVEFNGIEAPVVQEAVGEVVGTKVSLVQTFDVYGTLIWLAGMAAMLLYALISYLRLRYRVMVSINERDNIWLCDQIDSPFILGMFRPRIYMPSGMAEEQAAYVIAHEQAHLHRHDHWWKPFGFFLLAVYWFNPLIWVAYILLSRDIELACDEKVIRSMEIADKQAYSEALLVCSVNRRMIAACPLAFGEVGVEARVKSVLNYKKPAFWVVVGSVIICAVVAVCFLTDPAEEKTEPLGETVSWIHAPDGVAWHAAIHFNFRLEHTHIEASCDRGMLWDLYSEDKPKAQSIRFESGTPVCWTPIGESAEPFAEDAEIVFTIYNGNDELYSGKLKLVRVGENGDTASYEAVLVEGAGLTLLNADNGIGGVVTASDYSETFCNHMPGSYISTKWQEAPNPDPEKFDSVELRWDTYKCTFCGTPFDYNTGEYRNSPAGNAVSASGAVLAEDDFVDPVATAEKLLSRAFSFDPTNYKSEVSQNGDFWNITFDGEHHYVVELTPRLPYPQTLYEFRRVPPGGYGEVEIQVEGELVDIAEDFLWNAYALEGEDAQIDVVQGEDKICVQFVFSDTAIFHVRIHIGDLQPSGILFFNNLETARNAMEQTSIFRTEEDTQDTAQVEEPEPEPEQVETADHSNTADMNRWHREIEGKSVSYVCGEENNTYAAPPTWRPVFTEAGWSLVKIHHDTRNYTASWTYENGNQQIVFKCAAPSTASFGRQMSNADVATNSQQVDVLGKSADYYDDGSAKVLAWENEDGILFFVTGKNTKKEALLNAAKSVKNCTATVPMQSLGWMPSGYSMMSHYVIADTVMEYWVRDNVAMSWTCSAEPLGLPSGTGIATAIKNNEATYWAAEEPLALGTSVITVDGQAISIGGGVSSFTVPSPEKLNTLAWQNTETGIYYRLQSILDMDTMIRIAEHIE